MYKTKLLIFLALCLLTIGGIWTALCREFDHDRAQTQKAAEVNLNNLALAFEEHVLVTVQHIDSVLLELRDEYQQGVTPFEQLIKFHQKQKYNDLIIQASVIDPHGIMVYSPLPLPAVPLDLSDREHFRVHLNTAEDRLFISKPVLGRVSKKWSIQFTRKIFREDGSFGGVLVLSVDPRYFTGFFSTIQVGRQGVIALAGLDGVLRAGSSGTNPGVEITGVRLPGDRPYFNPFRPPAGIVRTRSSVDGIKKTFAYRRLKDYPLVVVVGNGDQEIHASSTARRDSLIQQGALVSSLLLAAFCLIAWFERKQQVLNEKLVASEDKLRLLNRSLEQRIQEEIAENNAKQRLILQQEKLASIGQLAAGVAHEINNPVGFITSNLRTLEGYLSNLTRYLKLVKEAVLVALPPAHRDLVDRAEKEFDIEFIVADAPLSVAESLDGTSRVSRIVSDLVGFSRNDEAEFAAVDLNECLETSVNIVNSELKYVATVVKNYGTLPQVECNAQQLIQVFINLLVNASQAIEKKGVITITSRAAGESVVVEISDTGAGIEEADRARIFEPFFTTKEVGKGTGLGLSIAYDIIQKHQGELHVESTPGEGSSFTVTVPCSRSGAESTAGLKKENGAAAHGSRS
jgi:signal transduction histidine kinase